MKNILETTGEILELVKEFNLEEIEIDSKDLHIRLSTVPPGARAPSTIAPLPVSPDLTNSALSSTATTIPQDDQETADLDYQEYATIASPMVGTFYRRPAPDKPPYVEENNVVQPGQSVCIIEAMKVMNEIKAEASGTVVEVLCKDGQAVEYGQALFKVRP